MRTVIKFRLLLGLSLTCLMALAIQSVYLLKLQDRLTAAGLGTDAPTQSIEAQILANLDDPDPANALWDPFARSTWPAIDPFSRMQQLQTDMNSLFDTFGPGSGFLQSGIGRMQAGLATPAIEVQETPAEYQIVITVSPETDINLQTSLEDNALTIQGTLKQEAINQGNHYAASTLSQSQFSRTIELPLPVDALGMTTSQNKQGIVILVPKKTA